MFLRLHAFHSCMFRVQKVLANRGFCSRRKAEELIESGRVLIDGKRVVLGSSCALEAEITVDGSPVPVPRTVYYAYYKPVGVQTSLSDAHTADLSSLLSQLGSRVVPAGRLDMDAEGLLLLSNDGDFVHRVMHPSFEKKKTYHATLSVPVTKQHLKQLSRGVTLRDGFVAVFGASKIDSHTVSISLIEGRNKIVKRLLRKVTQGTVTRLVRTQIGSVSLGTLRPGEYRLLTASEQASF